MRTLNALPLPKLDDTIESLFIKHGRSVIVLPLETFADVPAPTLGPGNDAKKLWESLLHEGDAPADAFVAECFANSAGAMPGADPISGEEIPLRLPRTVTGLKKMMALKEIPESMANELAVVLGIEKQPEWVDSASVERGQRFMWRIFGLYFSILGSSSLPGGYGVARVDQVLHMTGGITKEANFWLRILNTLEYELAVGRIGELMTVGKSGWWASVKVRLGHTFARYRAVELRKKNPEAMPGNEAPINQADMSMTILTFQAVALMALPRLIPSLYNYVVTPQDLEDFTHFWRFNGYLMGVTDKANCCTSYQSSLRLLHSYNHLYHGVSPVQAENLLVEVPLDKGGVGKAEDSHDGGVMAMQLWRYQAKFDPAHAPTFRVSVALGRICMGDEYCNAMGIEATNSIDLFRARVKTWVALVFAVIASFFYRMGGGRGMEQFVERGANKLHKKLLEKEMARREKLTQFYCSAACQTLAKPDHKPVCVTFQRKLTQHSHEADLTATLLLQKLYFDKDTICAICLDPLESPVALPSRHVFCAPCSLQPQSAIAISQACPMCRMPAQELLHQYVYQRAAILLQRANRRLPSFGIQLSLEDAKYAPTHAHVLNCCKLVKEEVGKVPGLDAARPVRGLLLDVLVIEEQFEEAVEEAERLIAEDRNDVIDFDACSSAAKACIGLRSFNDAHAHLMAAFQSLDQSSTAPARRVLSLLCVVEYHRGDFEQAVSFGDVGKVVQRASVYETPSDEENKKRVMEFTGDILNQLEAKIVMES
ncbi:hypothetical protein HDU98_009466 [Podochytrium sp. JEL0797]|nr:hypothetical protein HDU98_009466 [Podochytrium sp. JEL0797]